MKYHLKIAASNYHVSDKDSILLFNGWTDVEINIESMNLSLKAVYFCATNQHRWGKGYSLAEAKKNAGLTSNVQEKRCQFYVMAAILNDCTKEELDNIFACITANQIEGSPEYYKDGRTEEDTAMINKLHVGWLTVEKNY